MLRSNDAKNDPVPRFAGSVEPGESSPSKSLSCALINVSPGIVITKLAPLLCVKVAVQHGARIDIDSLCRGARG